MERSLARKKEKEIVVTDEKVISLPDDPQEIMAHLITVSDENTIVERLYPKIAKNAGREVLPQGIVMMFTLSVYDYAQQYPPMVGNAVRLFIPSWIDALIDDKEAAEAAKAFLKKTEDAANEERKAKTPPRVEPTGPIEDYDLYVAIRRIADIFFEEVRRAQAAGADLNVEFLNENVNPFYNQTDSGLFVEYYYSSPSKIWTPWGYWQCIWHVSYSGNPWEEILPRFLERIGATEHMPLRHASYGEVGPVYAVHRVDDVELPEPKVRERQNYLEYEVANKAWDNMTKRYEREHRSRR